ncbi:MAG: hypothetical protein ACRDRT_11265, partial [Pseudonocardiaceae bacterium]
MSILVVSSRLSSNRREALTNLVSIEGRPEVIDGAEFGPRALTSDLSAVVIDGPSPAVNDWLTTAAEASGLAIIGIGVPMFGVEVATAVPTGEVIAENDDPTNALSARLDCEFTLWDSFTPLITDHGGVTTLLSVSHRYVRWPAVVVGRRGRCRFVVSGLGHTDTALVTPALTTLFRRGMRSALPEGTSPTLGLGVVGYGRYGGMG